MSGLKIVAGSVVAVGVIGFIGVSCAANSSLVNQQTRTCTVQDKDRSSNSEGNSVHRIYTDCGTFEIRDALFQGNFNSADVYNSLKPGKTYELRTAGARIGPISSFPNIIEVIGEK